MGRPRPIPLAPRVFPLRPPYRRTWYAAPTCKDPYMPSHRSPGSWYSGHASGLRSAGPHRTARLGAGRFQPEPQVPAPFPLPASQAYRRWYRLHTMSMITGPSPITEGLFYRVLLFVGLLLLITILLARRPLTQLGRVRPDAMGPADRESVQFRNALAYALGLLWLLDGVLQAQPLMVNHFVGGALVPLLSSQPGFLRATLTLGIHLWSLSPIWLNALAVWIQVLIGVTLLFSRGNSPLRRAALVASITWALLIWVFGEALGTLFSGGGALSGAPGSALLYALGGALVLMNRAPAPARPVSRRGHQTLGMGQGTGVDGAFGDGHPAGADASTDAGIGGIARLLRAGFVAYFALMAILQALPASGWWRGNVLGTYVGTMAAMPQPAWLASILRVASAVATHHAGAANLVLVTSSAALAVLWLLFAQRDWLWIPTGLWVLVLWWLGQDFGFLGGMGTDPNTGGILLVFVILWARYGAPAFRMLPPVAKGPHSGPDPLSTQAGG